MSSIISYHNCCFLF
jgi:hypothetical protein